MVLSNVFRCQALANDVACRTSACHLRPQSAVSEKNATWAYKQRTVVEAEVVVWLPARSQSRRVPHKSRSNMIGDMAPCPAAVENGAIQASQQYDWNEPRAVSIGIALMIRGQQARCQAQKPAPNLGATPLYCLALRRNPAP